MEKRLKIISIALVAVVLVSIFVYEEYQMGSQKSVLVLSTTTSTVDSGLLDYLLPKFESKYNIDVRYLSLGTCLLYTSDAADE